MVDFEHLKALLDVSGDDMDRRDHALHLIFTQVLHSPEFKEEDVAAQLFRLYYIDGWVGARTFFCILTGVMLDDTVHDDEEYTVTVFFRDKGYFSFDMQSIVETCYDSKSGLNELYFTDEEEHSDDEEYYDDEEEEEEDEDEDEDEEEKDDERQHHYHQAAAAAAKLPFRPTKLTREQMAQLFAAYSAAGKPVANH